MSYTPKTWSNGDVINATDLNKIEQGIANSGGMLICNCNWDDDLSEYALDKTVSEIYDAYAAGIPVYVKYVYGTLGPSGTGAYVSEMYLAPVLKIYGYNYDNVIRICVSKPYRYSNISTVSNVFTPSYVIFQASGMSSYPTYYTSIYTNYNYVNINGGVG